MEYFTYKNRIAAIDNGEEIGEVTFAPQGRGPQHPERDGVYVILPDTEGGMACDASMGIEQRAGANHTYVDDRYRGQGIASELVRRAVEEIERRGGRVEATCSYALLWLARNRGCEITSPLSCPI